MEENSEYNKKFTDEYTQNENGTSSYDKVTSKKIKDAIKYHFNNKLNQINQSIKNK